MAPAATAVPRKPFASLPAIASSTPQRLGPAHAVPQAFIGVFNGDAALLDAGVPALRIYYCLFFCMAFQIAGQHTFVAVGRSRHAIFFSLLRKVIW